MQTLLNLEQQHRWSLGHRRRDSWTLLTLRHTPLQTLMLMLWGGLLRVLSACPGRLLGQSEEEMVDKSLENPIKVDDDDGREVSMR